MQARVRRLESFFRRDIGHAGDRVLARLESRFNLLSLVGSAPFLSLHRLIQENIIVIEAPVLNFCFVVDFGAPLLNFGHDFGS